MTFFRMHVSHPSHKISWFRQNLAQIESLEVEKGSLSKMAQMSIILLFWLYH
jgi:hypothetical protein